MSGNQQPASAGPCARHWAERAAGRRDDCGEEWCHDCLVPPVRKRQPVRCVECAMVAAGVRTRGARTSVMDMGRARRPTNFF